MKRYLAPFIEKDLARKMVFLGGPRQVGKTTLSKFVAAHLTQHYEYLNWDFDEHRTAILKKRWRADAEIIIFDELHKYPRWKQWIKGLADLRPSHQQYLVTGSARLDLYKRGGDSLLGRYHYWRLHPMTLDELPSGMTVEEGYRRLLSLGGFPEPFLLNDEREARRWRRERFDRILREDVRDLEQIRDIQLLGLFVNALRERVGGLVTLANIAQDLQISPKTAKTWLSLVERMYLGFSVKPYTRLVARSIQKPPKVYFYDNADVLGDQGAVLENLVATHLLKRLHFLEDYFGYRCELCFIRDKEGREVDFVTIIDDKIQDLIEVKWQDSGPSSSLKYYAEKLKPVRAVQIVGDLKRAFHQGDILVTSPTAFFVDPPWVKENIS